MTVPRTLVAALLLGSGLLGLSCYSELPPPPAFRYACESDGDCNSDEVCRYGLCERPCTQTSLFIAQLVEAEAQPCPFETYTGGCFNNACANTCELDSTNNCPPGQVCADVGIEVSGGGFFGGGSSSAAGVCVTACNDSDRADICTVGETCVEGVCEAIDCAAGEACNDGETCLFGGCMADCSAGQACPSGYECSDLLRVCTPECNQECGEGYECYFGVCSLSCEETADCPDPEAYSCVLGVCLSNDFDVSTGGSTTTSTTGDSTGSGDTGGETSTDGGSSGAMGSSDGGSGSTGMGAMG